MILIIDNYDSFTFNLFQICSEINKEIEVVRNDKITIEAINKLSPKGIILSPGPGIPEKAGICIPVIQAFSGKIPLLGVCLGHQAIGVAFGGKISKANVPVHGKSSLVFHSRTNLFQDVSLPFSAGRYHSLIVERETLPKILDIQAETADGVIMALKHAHHPTFGIQFHPESILTNEGKKILSYFVNLCGDKVLENRGHHV